VTAPKTGDSKSYIHVWDKQGETVLCFDDHETALSNYNNIVDIM
jgi:hypothetical protein